jgi:hypothetical protein
VVCDFLVSDVDDQEVATLIDDPRLAGVSLAHNAETDLGGRQVTTYALEELRGHVTWELHQGRGLAGDDEVVLGTRLARWLDAEVGDTVGSQAGPLTVVGVGLGPAASGELLGASALLTPATLRTLADGATFNEAYVEVADTDDRAAVAAEYGGTVEVTTVARPPEIEDLVRIDRLPVLLGVLLAMLGLAGLANGVVLGRRRRGHALAVLRTIGFTPGDAARSIVVMAVVCTMAGTAIGLPVGTAIGRLVWRTTAEATAVAGDPLSPIALLLVVPAALATALVVALAPAREAARRRPALFLREVE